MQHRFPYRVAQSTCTCTSNLCPHLVPLKSEIPYRLWLGMVLLDLECVLYPIWYLLLLGDQMSCFRYVSHILEVYLRVVTLIANLCTD